MTDIVINGQKDLTDSENILDLVVSKGLKKEFVVVELNGAILKKELWPVTPVRKDDRLELINFVGGG